ncbi:hypothetical protein [Campylobacter concisus]|uniref:hypothetical protein n=1 Tax=Campylobacter concisus TaxID=199 RepID=UPI001900F1F4|nr:hypothetical protein [Campylobacter concisus]
MKKVLDTAVLAAVLGVTGLQAAITSKDALNIAEKKFPRLKRQRYRDECQKWCDILQDRVF